MVAISSNPTFDTAFREGRLLPSIFVTIERIPVRSRVSAIPDHAAGAMLLPR
jgi:hypothetical protein